MKIPESFIDELIGRTDVVDLVSRYVTLTRKGSNLFGLCPFHSEKTPSFSVAPDKQIFHCFGCGKGGGVIQFVMQIENLAFPEAVRFLAERAGMEVPEEEGGQFGRRRDRVLELNVHAARFFYEHLVGQEGQEAAQYLAQRRVSKGVARRFGLGYAPDSWDKLMTAMGEKGFSKTELLDAGLVVDNKKGGFYDRFRGRLIFPILDIRNRVIGFGGRILGEGQPKYLNSPDTIVFNKSYHLYALNLAKKSKQGRIILAEGYMDVIALHQAGFDCAVASLGTSLTEQQSRLIAQYTQNVVIAYDSDQAGRSAAQRATGLLEKTGVNIRMLRLGDTKDPDAFIKAHGADAFRVKLEGSENHIEYALQDLYDRLDPVSDEQRVQFVRQAVGLLAGLDSPLERDVYTARAAKMAGVGVETVSLEVQRLRKKNSRRERERFVRQAETAAQSQMTPGTRQRPRKTRRSAAEETVVRILLGDPALCAQTRERLEPGQFGQEFLGRIYGEILRRDGEGLAVSLASLGAALDADEASALAYLLEKPAEENREQALNECLDIITRGEDPPETKNDEYLVHLVQKRYREEKGYGG